MYELLSLRFGCKLPSCGISCYMILSRESLFSIDGILVHGAHK